MRGFPLLNLIAAILVSGAVALPLVYRATRSAEAPAATPAGTVVSAKPDGTPGHISLRFVHPPAVVRLKSNGKILREWKVLTPALLLEDSIFVPLHDGRSEFAVEVQWPPKTPDTMVELSVEPDGHAARTANIWSSNGSADEIVTLTWKGNAP